MNKSPSKSKTSKRQALQASRQRKQRIKSLVWGVVGVGVIAVLGFILWQAFRPPAGETIPVPPEYVNHIEEGTVPGPYPSDPPAGGTHYPTDLPAKFFHEADAALIPTHPEGYLVHNLEHGYVIFWYNCALLDETGCTELKEDIQQVMDEFNGVKLIAFPWESLKEPVVMTSWGKLQRFETFNASQASAFVKANRNRAPEPNAD